MAEWVANQILIPRDEVIFSSFIEEGVTKENRWSDNLLNNIGGGFVRQIDIYGLPGMKIYAGPSLASEEVDVIDKYLILGPSGIFSMNIEDGYLLTDIRISKESYELLTGSLGGFVAFNIISSYAPSENSLGRIVIYNGGGVNNDVE